MNKNKKIVLSALSTSLVAALAFVLASAAPAFADSSGASAGSASGAVSSSAQSHHHHHWKRMKAVIQACAKANNITLPAKGSGEHLTAAERSDIHACVKSFRQDLRSCLQNAGVSKPAPGQKPSAADIAAFKQCRTSALSQISAPAN